MSGPVNAQLLSAKTSTGAGDYLNLRSPRDQFAMQVILTGGPATAIVTLEGTLSADASGVPTGWVTLGTWDLVGGPQTSGNIIFISGTPVTYVRANLTTLSGGTAPTVTAEFTSESEGTPKNVIMGADGSTPASASNPVPVNQVPQGYAATVSLTRTADTNAYAANDVLGAATGSTAALQFASMGPSGKEIIITSAQLEIDRNAIISGETSYLLYLYSVTPPSALGDNAAWDLPSGDRASFLGFITLGTPVDLGSTCYVEANIINKQVTLAGTDLFGYLVTVGAYTPQSATVHKIKLHAVAV